MRAMAPKLKFMFASPGILEALRHRPRDQRLVVARIDDLYIRKRFETRTRADRANDLLAPRYRDLDLAVPLSLLGNREVDACDAADRRADVVINGLIETPRVVRHARRGDHHGKAESRRDERR